MIGDVVCGCLPQVVAVPQLLRRSDQSSGQEDPTPSPSPLTLPSLRPVARKIGLALSHTHTKDALPRPGRATVATACVVVHFPSFEVVALYAGPRESRGGLALLRPIR